MDDNLKERLRRAVIASRQGVIPAHELEHVVNSLLDMSHRHPSLSREEFIERLAKKLHAYDRR